MSNNSRKPDTLRKGREHRSSPRYQLPSSPEVEILRGDTGALIQGRLGDLSRGGCYIETECELPLDAEVTITLAKSGDQVRALGRVVRTVPNQGLALSFTSMEAEDFRILESWLAMFVATTWLAANRRRSQRVAMQIEVRVSGYNGEGMRFTEDTRTAVISPFGCLVILRTAVKRGQRLVLFDAKTKRMVECMVAHHEAQGGEWQVGLAFTMPNQSFWPIDFPSVERSPHHPDKK